MCARVGARFGAARQVAQLWRCTACLAVHLHRSCIFRGRVTCVELVSIRLAWVSFLARNAALANFKLPWGRRRVWRVRLASTGMRMHRRRRSRRRAPRVQWERISRKWRSWDASRVRPASIGRSGQLRRRRALLAACALQAHISRLLALCRAFCVFRASIAIWRVRLRPLSLLRVCRVALASSRRWLVRRRVWRVRPASTGMRMRRCHRSRRRAPCVPWGRISRRQHRCRAWRVHVVVTAMNRAVWHALIVL